MIVFECSSACECSESDKDLKTTNSSSTTLPVKVSFYLFRQRNLNFFKSFNSEKNIKSSCMCGQKTESECSRASLVFSCRSVSCHRVWWRECRSSPLKQQLIVVVILNTMCSTEENSWFELRDCFPLFLLLLWAVRIQAAAPHLFHTLYSTPSPPSAHSREPSFTLNTGSLHTITVIARHHRGRRAEPRGPWALALCFLCLSGTSAHLIWHATRLLMWDWLIQRGCTVWQEITWGSSASETSPKHHDEQGPKLSKEDPNQHLKMQESMPLKGFWLKWKWCPGRRSKPF